MGKVNRNFKASVFTHLFAEPEKERGLYNAFSPTSLPPDAPVVDLTLTDVLYKDRVNDLAFSVGGKIVCFFEAQSTINYNMALRYLIYCGRVYEKLIDNDEIYNEDRIIIPTPEFYVLYSGVRPLPERETYRLSDSFAVFPDGEKPLELIVTAYNINPGYNDSLVKKDDNLYGYVTFVAKARKFEQAGQTRANAVKAAVEECIKTGILKEYLENNASEVVNMLAQEWDWNKALEINARNAARNAAQEAALETEQRVNAQWESMVADKDTALADKDMALANLEAEIEALKAKLSAQQG